MNTGSSLGYTGEGDRRRKGYKHVFEGIQLGTHFTVLGEYSPHNKSFAMDSMGKYSYCDTKTVGETIQSFESELWWRNAFTVAGLLVAGGVGYYESNH